MTLDTVVWKAFSASRKAIMNWARGWWGRFVDARYVVIYDTPGGLGWDEEIENYYGCFCSPDEAREAFYDAFEPSEVRNVKLCRIVKTWQEQEDK